MKNKHEKRSRISETKFKELIKSFSLDLDASKIAIRKKSLREDAGLWYPVTRWHIFTFK